MNYMLSSIPSKRFIPCRMFWSDFTDLVYFFPNCKIQVDFHVDKHQLREGQLLLEHHWTQKKHQLSHVIILIPLDMSKIY